MAPTTEHFEILWTIVYADGSKKTGKQSGAIGSADEAAMETFRAAMSEVDSSKPGPFEITLKILR